MFRKSLSVLLAFVLMLGVFTIYPLTTNAKEFDIAEVGAQQKAMFIMETMSISQGMYGSYSHQGSKAIDFTGSDGGIDPAYAPFDGKVVYISTSAAYIIYESTSPVEFADGTVDYMTVWVMHDNNVGRFYVGQTFSQGEHFFNEGSAGYATGNHIHLECARGTYQGQYKNDYGVWCIKNQINPYDALYLSESTYIISDYGYNWRRTSTPDPIPQGYVMSESEGAGRTIPDGDYWINSEMSQNYFLDLMGNETVTSNGANVQMWIWENAIPTKYDAFHFEYLNNGYYKISQFGTNQCLDVNEASLNRGSNIQLWESNGTNAQQWSVEKTNHGYKIRSRCCNFYLDICGAKYENGTNMWTWEGYETKSQNFCLIPYSPNERPLADGVYSIWSELDSSLFLDAIGTPEGYKNDTNIDVWYGDEGEQFRIEYAGEGWYRIFENKSGLALEIYNNSDTFMRNGENAKLYQKNDSRGQFWKIKKHTDGSYFLINKMTGYYLDVSHANLENGSDVYQWQYNGGAPNQRWRFIPQGRLMSESEGAGRTIPDGDYWINSELSQNYFLDLMGNEYTTSNGTNVQMWIWENAVPSKYDAFHFEYLNNGYYKISQYGTDYCLEVNKGLLNRGSNIQLWKSNGTNAQQWSVEKTNHGYKIRSRCCNYYLDICGAKYENGTNVWTWEGYETKSQNFCLIPYSPDERPLADGVYIIWSELDDNLFLDALGTPEDYKNDTNIDVWYGTYDDKYRIEYAGNGWYRIYEYTSGLALEIYNNSDTFMQNGENAKLYQKNDSRGQLWKIKKHSDGTFFLINKMTGYYLDVNHANLENGSNVYQWQYNGGALNQRWRFTRDITSEMVTVESVIIENKNEEIKPKVTVTVDGSTLVADTDYTIEISSDLDEGKGTIIVRGINNYCGTVTKEFAISVISSSDPSIIKLGDVDFDGNVEIRDATWIQRHAADIDIPIAISKTTADVDGDDNITVMDATAIQYYLANMKTPYKIGEKIE